MGEADLGARLRALELHELSGRDRLERRGVLVAEGGRMAITLSVALQYLNSGLGQKLFDQECHPKTFHCTLKDVSNLLSIE